MSKTWILVILIALVDAPITAGPSQLAWSENAGWINAAPAVVGVPGLRVFTGHVEGWLWGENTGWISLSCHNTGSCHRVRYGVEHDGAGILTGFAWAENTGWISFSCADTASCATVSYGVTVDPVTGDVSGYAWAENTGWISFSCANTASCGQVAYGVTVPVPFPTAVLFADGFETGGTDRWSSTVP